MAYNIREVTGYTETSTDVWSRTVDISNPSVTVVSGNFNLYLLGSNQGEASGGYTFSALNTTDYGSLTYNTTNGTFSFTIDRAALYDSDANQTVTFTVTGHQGGTNLTDTVRLNFVICVARGTMVQTGAGEVPVEDLRAGDKVWTQDDGLQAVRWIASRRVTGAELAATPSLRPVRLRAGALGPGCPSRDLIVSPQHRIQLSDWRAQMFFGQDQVLAAAKSLVNDSTITVENAADEVEYFHILFDRHQIIMTDGAPTESFYPGPCALREIAPAARAELLTLFPDLVRQAAAYGPSARHSLKHDEARLVTLH